MNDDIEYVMKNAKRTLGEGRWDKILKREMVALSVADNYDDAKYEWKATGEVWWQGIGTPRPAWASEHPDKCLCSHSIVYHFEIENTETGHRDCVGSDHINSYMVLRAIKDEMGIDESAITEEMIEEWIKTKVSSMMKTAWWNENGDWFTTQFDAIKELDLRVNVHFTGKHIFDKKLGVAVPETKIRKKGKGTFGLPDYKMSSIVWRWNHPDNPKAQINTKGYPNDKLLADMIMFNAMIDVHRESVLAEDEEIEKRVQSALRYKEQKKIRDAILQEQKLAELRDGCDYFDIPVFSSDMATNDWEKRFLFDMEIRVRGKNELTERQLESLMNIINRYNDKPTERQVNYLRALGYDGETESLTRGEVSKLIDKLKEEKI
jgi:hypothetical protein|tara:strand:- start:200 stop:1330 length:1131 start_codon:yes stop_codon:yes gene_type:complete